MSTPISATTVYSYAALPDLHEVMLAGGEISDRGDWMPIGSYTPGDAVTYSGALYFCISANTGLPPTGNIDDNWSALVVVEEFNPVVSAGSDYTARLAASQALAVAQAGTAFGTYVYDQLIIETGSRIAGDTYLLALFGSITADTVIYGRNGEPTVGSALDTLFYVSPSVTGFTNDIGVVETGGSVSVITLNWAYNKAVISQSINQGIGALPAAVRTFAISGAYTTTLTFALTASDGSNTCNGNSTVSFMQKRYWGNSSQTSLNDAQIIALNSEFASSRSQSRTVSPSGEYLYFAYPTSFGAATFTVNGLLNTDWMLDTRAFINASGYSESYRIYRSTNLLTGTYQIVVS